MPVKPNDYCSQCPQRDGCRDVYQQLGQSDAPNVAGKVFLAFLVPIGLFIALLIGLDKGLPEFEAPPLRILTMFGVSIAVTVAAVWLVKRIEIIRNR